MEITQMKVYNIKEVKTLFKYLSDKTRWKCAQPI